MYEAHAHIALDGQDWKAALLRHQPQPDDAAIRLELQRYADAGISYIRDGGDKYLAGLRAAQLAPEYGIRYVSPAFPLYVKGSYGAFLGKPFETFEDAQELINQARALGATFVKIMTTGILDFAHFGIITASNMDAQLLADIVNYAHSLALPVMAHTNGAQAIKDALAAGVDSVEHGYYANAESLELMAQKGTIWVPTLAPICNLIGKTSDSDTLQQIAESQFESICTAARFGVYIACGSDAGAGSVTHAQGAKDEMAWLEQALGSKSSAIEVTNRAFEALQKKFG